MPRSQRSKRGSAAVAFVSHRNQISWIVKLLRRHLRRHNLRHGSKHSIQATETPYTILAYHDRHFPIAVGSRDVATIDREEMLSRGTGGFDIKKYQQPSSQTAITVIMKERHSRQFARATMEVNSVTPHSVVRFEINPIATPVEFLEPDDPLPPGPLEETKRKWPVERIASEVSSQRSAKGWLRRSVNVW